MTIQWKLRVFSKKVSKKYFNYFCLSCCSVQSGTKGSNLIKAAKYFNYFCLSCCSVQSGTKGSNLIKAAYKKVSKRVSIIFYLIFGGIFEKYKIHTKQNTSSFLIFLTFLTLPNTS